uniref:BZIP domain-containing protein n=1 Tax=Gopherus agassizii TaxID=38772 RepID=A0A452H2A9_9SAUR
IENTSSTSQSTAGLVRDNSIEEVWQDFLLSPELQVNTQPVASSSRGMNSLSSHYTVNLTHAISHDVCLHEATLLRSNHSTRVNPEIRSVQRQESFLQLNSISHSFFKNLTHTTSSNNSDSSSVSTCSEGAIGYSSDIEHTSHNGLGGVGGHYPERSKHCHVDYQSDSDYCEESTLQYILHNHTYNHLPNELASTSKHHSSSSEKSNKVKGRCLNSTDNLSHDEHHVKALRILFSQHVIKDLTDIQISLIRDIRRRGRNKVAAQNCCKRKLDVIRSLEDDVCKLQAPKESLKNLLKQKLNDLYYVIFSRLRDDQGRPVNPSQYALHCRSNGSVLIIPKRLGRQAKDDREGKAIYKLLRWRSLC